MSKVSAGPVTKPFRLALQGAGSHGAFTWGVLDRILEEPLLEIEAVSGVSAGAVNGAALVAGIVEGGPERARDLLSTVWHATAKAARLGWLQPGPLDEILGDREMHWSPAYQMFDLMMRVASPYQLNPLDINPLKQILTDTLDLKVLGSGEGPRFFVGATEIMSGELAVFEDADITMEVLLASSCLPFISQAVEISGRRYWDVGNAANPPLTALTEADRLVDIVIVQAMPQKRPIVPMDQTAIIDRMNEIATNHAYRSEARLIDAGARIVAAGGNPSSVGLPAARLHRIQADWRLADFGAASKLNSTEGFQEELFVLGRATAETWLEEHAQALGESSGWVP